MNGSELIQTEFQVALRWLLTTDGCTSRSRQILCNAGGALPMSMPAARTEKDQHCTKPCPHRACTQPSAAARLSCYSSPYSSLPSLLSTPMAVLKPWKRQTQHKMSREHPGLELITMALCDLAYFQIPLQLTCALKIFWEHLIRCYIHAKAKAQATLPAT